MILKWNNVNVNWLIVCRLTQNYQHIIYNNNEKKLPNNKAKMLNIKKKISKV